MVCEGSKDLFATDLRHLERELTRQLICDFTHPYHHAPRGLYMLCHIELLDTFDNKCYKESSKNTGAYHGIH